MRLQTRAFAIACGYVFAATAFLLTLVLRLGGYSAADVPGMGAIFFGYSVSVPGAFIAALWSFAYGFLLGAGMAFAYNLAVIPAAPPPFDWDLESDPEEG